MTSESKLRTFAYVASLALLMSFDWSAIDEAQAEYESIRDARQAAELDARIREHCGSVNSAYQMLPSGEVQCFLKNGKKTRKVML